MTYAMVTSASLVITPNTLPTLDRRWWHCIRVKCYERAWRLSTALLPHKEPGRSLWFPRVQSRTPDAVARYALGQTHPRVLHREAIHEPEDQCTRSAAGGVAPHRTLWFLVPVDAASGKRMLGMVTAPPEFGARTPPWSQEICLRRGASISLGIPRWNARSGTVSSVPVLRRGMIQRNQLMG